MRTDLEVWQVLQAVRHVLLIHKTYTPARLNACNHVLIDRVTGINVPTSFFEEFGTDASTTDQADTTDANHTETLFRSILPQVSFHASSQLVLIITTYYRQVLHGHSIDD